MTHDPLISVVIPSYMRRDKLKHALTSVRSQTYENWEAIVVDNMSDDGTEDMIQEFDDSRFRLEKIENEGIVARSRNRGIECARGQFVAFLDSDDWWLETKLSQCLKPLQANADVTYHDLWITKNPSQRTHNKVRTWALGADPYRSLLRRGNALANSGVTVRKDLLIRAGGQCEDRELVGMEDFDLWLRLANAGARFHRQGEVLGYYRLDDTNLSGAGRTLIALPALAGRHPDMQSENIGWWFEYGMGRSQYLMYDKAAAGVHLRNALRKLPPPMITVKILKMLLF